MARRARPSDSPDATRARLLASALRLFGARGFDGVSTRELADDAGANIAAIAYHFGGKEGLYVAVAEAFARERAAPMRALAAGLREELGRLPRGPAGRRAAAALVGRLLAGMVRTLLGQPDAHDVLSFVVREQLRPTAAFDALFEHVIRPLHETLTALVARATGRPEADPRMIIQAHALVGTALAFGFARAAALRRLGWTALGEDELRQVAEVVAHVGQQACGAPPARGRAR